MRKIILPAILLIAGLAIGYLIGHKSSQDFIKETYRKQVLQEVEDEIFKLQGKRESREIDPVIARRLIKEYDTQNRGANIPIRNSDQEPLKGFYIDRAPFDKILTDKTFTGISFYFAKNPKMEGVKGNFYTLVYMGAKKVANPIKQGDTTIDNGGPAYDYVDPCPKACGNF